MLMRCAVCIHVTLNVAEAHNTPSINSHEAQMVDTTTLVVPSPELLKQRRIQAFIGEVAQISADFPSASQKLLTRILEAGTALVGGASEPLSSGIPGMSCGGCAVVTYGKCVLRHGSWHER